MIILFMFLSIFLTAFFPPQNSQLILTVENVSSPNGVVRVLLFKGKDGFPDNADKAFRSASAPIDGNKAVFKFENLPEGEYAISTFHDSQNKGEIRTNAFGIPRDGYGFSNDVMGNFGPPAFEKAAFKVAAGTNNVSIKLR
jgi:uncharacterized protein (DUF2141 family)